MHMYMYELQTNSVDVFAILYTLKYSVYIQCTHISIYMYVLQNNDNGVSTIRIISLC